MSGEEKEEKVSHGMCRECYIQQRGQEPPVTFKPKGVKTICAWCQKVMFDPKDKKPRKNPDSFVAVLTMRQVRQLRQALSTKLSQL